jgi:hypothetical protein
MDVQLQGELLMAWVLLALSITALIVLFVIKTSKESAAKQAAEVAARSIQELTGRNASLAQEVASLSVFKEVRDVAAEATRLREQAEAAVNLAQAEAKAIRDAAESYASKLKADASTEAQALERDSRTANADARKKAATTVDEANSRAAKILADAETRAVEIAGDAYKALQDAARLEKAALAMKNVIEGYGDRYLVPTYSLLDELADEYGFEEAGRELKAAREVSKSLLTSERAASCDYVEANRKETAIRFVLDAFNGKVESILGRVKSDNAGTLEQQIRDAFALVNFNGAAFRNARITPEYLAARLEELKWAAAAVALRERDKEEQRRIREQIREEEKARREIDRALRDAAKEEETLQRAVERVQSQVARANDEQRAAFELQLADLRVRLAEAEAKNQRALSMAQLTKAGHVYVVSNIGSFGDDVFKVGMTRRLEPLDRVKELGDASVPFSFDVHAMIWAEDAPALERVLHKRFVTNQINKVNPRKEFFRIGISDVRSCVEELGFNCSWTLAAQAAQFRETQAIERALADGTPVAREWLQSQLAYEPETPVEAESEAG